MTEPTLTCPECGSDRVTTEHHQMFMVNACEHYCHSVKTHDADSLRPPVSRAGGRVSGKT